MIRLESYS